MSKIDWPKDKELAGKIAAAHAAQESQKLEMGLMGRLFGSVAHKPGNIAGFALIMFSIIFVAVLIWGVDSTSLSKKDALTIVASFITLSLGFIFGHSRSGAPD